MIREELKFTSFWYGTVCIRQTQFNFSKVSNSFSAKFSARGGERLYGLEENCPSHKALTAISFDVGVDFAPKKKIAICIRSSWNSKCSLRYNFPKVSNCWKVSLYAPKVHRLSPNLFKWRFVGVACCWIVCSIARKKVLQYRRISACEKYFFY